MRRAAKQQCEVEVLRASEGDADLHLSPLSSSLLSLSQASASAFLITYYVTLVIVTNISNTYTATAAITVSTTISVAIASATLATYWATSDAVPVANAGVTADLNSVTMVAINSAYQLPLTTHSTADQHPTDVLA
jgi:hypothetical protein